MHPSKHTTPATHTHTRHLRHTPIHDTPPHSPTHSTHKLLHKLDHYINPPLFTRSTRSNRGRLPSTASTNSTLSSASDGGGDATPGAAKDRRLRNLMRDLDRKLRDIDRQTAHIERYRERMQREAAEAAARARGGLD
jgi:hypothetical protein